VGAILLKEFGREMLPPTRGALLPHIIRANYIAMWDKSYSVACPNLPPIERNGWNMEDGVHVPIQCLTLPSPRAVLEMRKCGCKSGCNGRRLLATIMHFLALLSVNGIL